MQSNDATQLDEVKKERMINSLSQLNFIKKKNRKISSKQSNDTTGPKQTVDKSLNSNNIPVHLTDSKHECPANLKNSKAPCLAFYDSEVDSQIDKNSHYAPNKPRRHSDLENSPPISAHPGLVATKPGAKQTEPKTQPLNEEKAGLKGAQKESFFRKIPPTSEQYRNFCMTPTDRSRVGVYPLNPKRQGNANSQLAKTRERDTMLSSVAGLPRIVSDMKTTTVPSSDWQHTAGTTSSRCSDNQPEYDPRHEDTPPCCSDQTPHDWPSSVRQRTISRTPSCSNDQTERSPSPSDSSYRGDPPRCSNRTAQNPPSSVTPYTSHADDNNNKADIAAGKNAFSVEKSTLNPNVASFVPVYYANPDYATMVANQSVTSSAVFCMVPNNVYVNSHPVSRQLMAVPAASNQQLSGQCAVAAGVQNTSSVEEVPAKEKRRTRVGYVLNRKPKEAKPTKSGPSTDVTVLNAKASVDTNLVKTLDELDAMRLNSMRKPVYCVDEPSVSPDMLSVGSGGFRDTNTNVPTATVQPSGAVEANANAVYQLPDKVSQLMLPAVDYTPVCPDHLEKGVETAPNPLWFYGHPAETNGGACTPALPTVQILDESNANENPMSRQKPIERKTSWPRRELSTYPGADDAQKRVVNPCADDNPYWIHREMSNRPEQQYASFPPKTFDQSQIDFKNANSMTINVRDDLFVAKDIANNLPQPVFVQPVQMNTAVEPAYVQPSCDNSGLVLQSSIRDTMALMQMCAGLENMTRGTAAPPPLSGVSSQPPVAGSALPTVGREQSVSHSVPFRQHSNSEPLPTNVAPPHQATGYRESNFSQRYPGTERPRQSSEERPNCGQELNGAASEFAQRFSDPERSRQPSEDRPNCAQELNGAAPEFAQRFPVTERPRQPSKDRFEYVQESSGAAPESAQRFPGTEMPRRPSEDHDAFAHFSANNVGGGEGVVCSARGRRPPGIPVSNAGPYEIYRHPGLDSLKHAQSSSVSKMQYSTFEPSAASTQYSQQALNDDRVGFTRVPPGFEYQPLPEPPATGILKYPSQLLDQNIGFEHVQGDVDNLDANDQQRQVANSFPKRVTFASQYNTSS